MRHINRRLNNLHPTTGEVKLCNYVMFGLAGPFIVTGISAKGLEVREFGHLDHTIENAENLRGASLFGLYNELVSKDLLLDNGFTIQDDNTAYKVFPATPQWFQSTMTIRKDWGNESWHVRYEEGNPKESGEGITFIIFYLHEFQNKYYEITGEYLKQREYLPAITEKAQMHVDSDQLSKYEHNNIERSF